MVNILIFKITSCKIITILPIGKNWICYSDNLIEMNFLEVLVLLIGYFFGVHNGRSRITLKVGSKEITTKIKFPRPLVSGSFI